MTESEASRLLTQATFGPTESAISSTRLADATSWINAQLAMPQGPSFVSQLDARLVQLRAANAGAVLTPSQFYEAFWQNAVTGADQLRQRMRFALSQIMVISLLDPVIDDEIRGAGAYYDVLGANAFGNYRTLLEQVSLHPMMGLYLTHLGNQKEDPAGTRTPDENYAREVMQLFSIGVYRLNLDGTLQRDIAGQPIPTYGEADIAGLAKVFTGFSWYSPTPSTNTFAGRNRDPESSVRPMIAYAAFHSTSQKSFLGTTIPASATVDATGDLRIALDTLFNHPNVGPFMATRLIQQFVTSNPTPAYVQRVATVFNNNGSGVRGDLGAVIRAVLLDAEARNLSVINSQDFGKLREPVIRITNWMRGFGATSQSGNWLMVSTASNTSLFQAPLTAPSVFNFWRPGYVPPSTQLASRNLLAPEFSSVDEVAVAGYLNTLQTTVNTGIGSGNDIRSSYTAEIALANDAAALVGRVNTLLLYGQMSAGLRQNIIDAVKAIAVTGTQAQIDAALLNRAKLAVYLAMSSPEYLAQR